ncbi:uncharacterized protein LOC122319782 [Drosophila ficusphila]|uniref:uncharacterized protein LOC122319782 n=1 Tax=Drosophila ficusphila TaxID=30025 RepID=UPI001C894D17|nr:uncharacterized protein LOC122319782 [Drosophila ficusphila]
MSKPAVKERKPGNRRIPRSKSFDSLPSGSKRYLNKSYLYRDSADTFERRSSSSNDQYRNCMNSTRSENGYEAGLDTDDAIDEDRDSIAAAYLRSRSRLSSLNSFVQPEPIPSHRFGRFFRALGRSLHHCSLRIAAGFGLSHQQAAWYKNCWQSPGSRPKGIHLLGPQRLINHSIPNSRANSPEKPRAIESSTTL